MKYVIERQELHSELLNCISFALKSAIFIRGRLAWSQENVLQFEEGRGKDLILALSCKLLAKVAQSPWFVQPLYDQFYRSHVIKLQVIWTN